MKHIVILLVLYIVVVPVAQAGEKVSDDDILNAFLDSAEVKNAQQQFGDKTTQESPRILFTQGQCGVVGCPYSVLVSQEFSYEGVNPWTRHILGLVSVSASREILEVHLVKLVLVNEEED